MINVLTYNVPHRKTYDVLCLLKSKGYNDVSVYAAPFHYKKAFTPLYEHRPEVMDYMPEPKTLCSNLGYKCTEIYGGGVYPQ